MICLFTDAEYDIRSIQSNSTPFFYYYNLWRIHYAHHLIFNMSRDQGYSAEVKSVFLRVIEFVEKERDSPMIPLNLTTARLVAVLGISERSIFNLKAGMKKLREMEQSDQRNIVKNRELRSRSTSTDSSTSRSPLVSRSHRNRKFTTVSVRQTNLVSVPVPMPPNKISNPGRP